MCFTVFVLEIVYLKTMFAEIFFLEFFRDGFVLLFSYQCSIFSNLPTHFIIDIGVFIVRFFVVCFSAANLNRISYFVVFVNNFFDFLFCRSCFLVYRLTSDLNIISLWLYIVNNFFHFLFTFFAFALYLPILLGFLIFSSKIYTLFLYNNTIYKKIA